MYDYFDYFFIFIKAQSTQVNTRQCKKKSIKKNQ